VTLAIHEPRLLRLLSGHLQIAFEVIDGALQVKLAVAMGSVYSGEIRGAVSIVSPSPSPQAAKPAASSANAIRRNSTLQTQFEIIKILTK